jgi:hypothetical protein
MPGRLRRERIDVVLEQVGLGGRGRDKIGGYSKGMTQRIGLAQALLADPALVLLDEPTSALDPVGRRDVPRADPADQLRGRDGLPQQPPAQRGRAGLRPRRDHRPRADRAVRPARELMGPVVHVRVDVDRVDEALLSAIDRYGDIADVTATSVTLTVDDAAVAADVGDLVVRKGYRLFALVPVQQSLEDVFVDLVHGRDVVNPALHVASWTVREAIRRKLVVGLFMLSVVYIGLFALGFRLLYERVSESISPTSLEDILAANILTVLGLYAVQFLAAFLALFLAVGSISAEIDSGMLHACCPGRSPGRSTCSAAGSPSSACS